MSVANKIAPNAAPSVAPATNRVGGAGARGLASGGSIEDLSQSSWVGGYDVAPRFDERRQDFSGFGDQRGRRQQDLWVQTPLVVRYATGFQASEINEEKEGSGSEGSFKSMMDAVRGVGVYERNMRVTANEPKSHGTVINRFY